ncbi:plasmid partitioning protein RepB [Chelatococcus asaccharovorans]|uniref:ParB family protein n=1 Tax=Chelatococcus asaccharovorans TaxID=28210 RepID=A0A2V3UFN8_9HYPH|nr:plasmid partitioning protein RepB [Chelatococcus asaccharovorans]MBS7707379.1 plasmid partitioning protein RepB [Chelatococcus asaccharovorans]PXW63561.1 ParB family protein [Chelatococcus asaccharovorans]CAH1650556.1 putative replication protein B [Chelatococcus asaccharovorans]CAH1692363.1 putative replication protein B [Chelatococcus asaccharovorans]
MSRKDAINSLFLQRPAAPAAPVKPERVRSGAVAAMGSSLQEMAENAKTAARLQQQLAEGEAVVSIDPTSIDGSPIADRLPMDVDPGFDQLVASIAEFGQQIPILVRPHPSITGRFQVAYGRRRLRAAAQLGRQVKAIIRKLNDDELVVAQGRENLDREDLSFIEKALFARRLEDSGYDRATIIAALGTDKADLSRYIAIARKVPETLIQRIGPAPKAGRARWALLAEKIEAGRAQKSLEPLFASSVFQSAQSDARFVQVLKGLTGETAKPSRDRQVWTTPTGRKAGRIERQPGRTALVFDEKIVPDFASFVSDRLDDLYREFRDTHDGGAD